MFLGLTFAWFYVVIPDSQVWIYIFIKQEWWSIFGIALYAEFTILCIPLLPDWIYISLYLFGIGLPPILRVIAYVTNNWSNRALQLLTTTIGLPILLLALFYVAFLSDVKPINLRAWKAKENNGTLQDERSSGSNVSETYYDTYKLCCTSPEQQIQQTTNKPPCRECIQALAEGISGGRKLYLKLLPFTLQDISSSSASSSSSSTTSVDSSSPQEIKMQTYSTTFPTFPDSTFLTFPPAPPSTPTTATTTTITRRSTFLMTSPFYTTSSRDSIHESLISPSFTATVEKEVKNADINPESNMVEMDKNESTAASNTNNHSISAGIWSICCCCAGYFCFTCTSILKNQFPWILFPKFYYQQLHLFPGIFFGSIRYQCFLVACFFFISNAFFFSLYYFTEYFRRKSTMEVSSSFELYFILFICISTLARLLMKRLGLELDKQKLGTTSMYFVAEFLGLMYFYTFYRLLFESIKSWGVFFSLQVIHVSIEWICYPLRASSLCYQLMKRIEHKYFYGQAWLIPKHTNFEDWLDFITLDFGVRVVVMISTAIGIMILLITVEYIPWIHNGLQQDNRNRMWTSCSFIMIAVIMELLNTYLMNQYFFKSMQADIWHLTAQCFQDIKFQVIVFIITVNLFINPLYAWTDDDQYHYQSR
jgi:hypothetical protein